MSQEAQLESQRRVVDYLQTELAVERTLAQGRAAREANIALALQRSVNGLAATTCDLMRAPRSQQWVLDLSGLALRWF